MDNLRNKAVEKLKKDIRALRREHYFSPLHSAEEIRGRLMEKGWWPADLSVGEVETGIKEIESEAAICQPTDL